VDLRGRDKGRVREKDRSRRSSEQERTAGSDRMRRGGGPRPVANSKSQRL